ncbi:MAG: mycofactocin-associated electron transfer flavoprotein alpha subunit [Microthrixaceae bacterium]
MIAVVPVREGALPAGGAEVVAEADGRVLLVGEGADRAVEELGALAAEVELWDTPGFAPGAWAEALGPRLVDEALVLLPASPDGRDLAPRIAVVLGHELLSGALEIRGPLVRTVGYGGTAMLEHHLQGAAVVTLQPGVRGIDPCVDHHDGAPRVTTIAPSLADPPKDCRTVEVLPPDASTMDLAEAPRILAGGNGLPDAAAFETLAAVAERLDASVGTTRVITDKGWLPHERQIGTTGVVVDPRLYVAFGISGAVQHTSGLGQPDHVISVNTDPHCPMMSLADLALVADASETLEALGALLGASPAGGSGAGG